MVDYDADECEQCGSRQFHEDDGLLYCIEGHQQFGGQREGSDDEDFGVQGRIARKKEVKAKVKPIKVYRGKRAFKLFLHAYQHILWQQCYTLVHDKGVVSELWTIVRDLWTLRLSKLLSRIEEPQTVLADGAGLTSAEETGEETGEESLYGMKSIGKTGGRPTLTQTIGLCYIAMLLLRLPVSLSTILRWIEKEEIVYFRAIRHVPPDIKDKLPGEYHEALDTSTILQADTFQSAVMLLVKYYSVTFDLEIPALNYRPLLFDYIKKLLLPIEVYKATEMIQTELGDLRFDFRYNTNTNRRTATSFPEAQLMTLVVVAVKLLYPFDSAELRRRPRTTDEPATLRVDWPTWRSTMQKLADQKSTFTSIPRKSDFRVTDEDVFRMSPPQLDAYMDWYQRTWSREVDDHGRGSRRELLAMFPLKALSQTPPHKVSEEEIYTIIDETVTEFQSTIKLNPALSDDDVSLEDSNVVRPGAMYAHHRVAPDLDGDVMAKAFYEAAAEVACLSVDMLVRATVQTERKIALWRRAKDREEAKGKEAVSNAEIGQPDLPV